MEMIKILDKIIFWSYAALFFFVPLLLTPWNYELFEFNKMVLVYLLTVVIVSVWIGKMLLKRKIIFRRTFWDIPLFLFLTSQVVSTIVSIDRHTSIFGYYSRFHGGLLSTVCYLLLYWAFVSNLTNPTAYAKSWRSSLLNVKKKLIKIILFSGALVALYGIAEHFGIDRKFWVQDVQNRVFSTLGQPNWLAAYLDILIFIVLAKITQSSKLFTIHYSLFTIFYICLLYTKSRSGFLGFIIPFLIFLTNQVIHIIKEKDDKSSKKLFFTLGIFLLISLLVGTPFQLKSIRSRLNFSFLSDVQEEKRVENQPKTWNQKPESNPNITPSSDIRKIVWLGAIELWKKHPWFGTGVETFGYSYYWTRPKEHNLTSEWDFLYNKAHNEYLNFAATTGTFGLLSYLLLALAPIIYSLKKGSKSSLFTVHYSLLTVLITNFFGFSVVPVALLFFLLPACTSEDRSGELATSGAEPKNISKAPLSQGIKLLAPAFAASFLLFKIASYWLADYHFAKGNKLEKAGYLQTGIKQLTTAIKLNANEPNFYSQRAVSYSKLVAALAQGNQASAASQFVRPAIKDSQAALQISPFHLNFYKNQAKVFYYLAFYQPDYLQEALKTLFTAEKLAPTDPKIPYNIGLIYQTLDKNKQAEEYFQKALELKPDYQSAQAALGKLPKINP